MTACMDCPHLPGQDLIGAREVCCREEGKAPPFEAVSVARLRDIERHRAQAEAERQGLIEPGQQVALLNRAQRRALKAKERR